MKRTLSWGAFAAFAVLLPPILRWIAGQPLLPGTEAYALALLLEPFLPRSISLAIIVFLGTGLMALATAIAHQELRKSLPKWALNATLALIIFSPVVFATAYAPSQAVFALLLALALRVKDVRKAGVLFTAIFVMVVAHIVLQGVRPATQALVELGGLNAYGMFTLIAGIAGAYVLWENKARNYFLTLAILALVTLSFIYPTLMLFGTVAVAAVAGIGLVRLSRQRWVFPLVRTLTLILFFCGILFASISSLTLLANAPPSAKLASGLAELRYTLPEGKILSHDSYATWISYWAQRPAAEIPESIQPSIWYSRNIDNTTLLLEAYGVSSIVVTPQMRSGLVWTGDEQGLMFLVAHSKKFKRIESGNIVEAWAFVPESP